jgi:hypothetical protein
MYSVNIYISPTKRKFFVTQTISETEIPALPDSWVTNTLSVKMLCPQIKCFPLYCHTDIASLSVGLLRIGQVSPVCYKTVYWWVTAYCCFMTDTAVALQNLWLVRMPVHMPTHTLYTITYQCILTKNMSPHSNNIHIITRTVTIILYLCKHTVLL